MGWAGLAALGVQSDHRQATLGSRGEPGQVPRLPSPAAGALLTCRVAEPQADASCTPGLPCPRLTALRHGLII